MKKTTLEEKFAIACGLEAGKTYEQLAAELHLSKRVVQKWAQHIKKKGVFMSCYGSAQVWLLR